MAFTAATATKYRIESIDILRGLVMLIMAIDHVRDFFHPMPEPTDLALTTPILFFTRWVTHFCAPTFVLLSGVSAFLAGTRRTRAELSAFLIARGLWLLLVEIGLVTLAITLNPLYNVLILQVIWAIGSGMIIMGILIRLKATVAFMGIVGAIILFSHNIIDVFNFGHVTKSFWWHALFSSPGFSDYWVLGPDRGVLVAYALIPWTGVMMLGYAFGAVYKKSFDPVKRRRILLNSGLLLLAVFLVFRYFNIYGDPAPWSVQKTSTLSVISFFNVTKYPCSLLYLCMTLGMALLILALTEKVKNKFTGILIIYGNVPFFYYLCHWYLMRFFTVITFFVTGYSTNQIVTPGKQLLFQPPGFQFNLFVVYLLWIIIIVILYFPCRWFSNYKKTHQNWWLSYL